VIYRSIYRHGGVDIKRVRRSGDLYRLKFSSDARAAARLVDNTFVILRIGKKRHVEQFYAKYFRSPICRKVQDWVRLEDSGIDPFADRQSLKSVANSLTERLDGRIDAVERKADALKTSVGGLQEDVELLELCEQDRQTATQELKQRVESLLKTIQDRLGHPGPVVPHQPEERTSSHPSLAMRTWRRLVGPDKRKHPTNIGRNGHTVAATDQQIGGQPR
jgi:hypothetical protein